jgi:L-threonylcarbamoyladenylate synthase
MQDGTNLISRAGEILKFGGVVIVPTETFYALAADPFQEKAVLKIFLTKRRDQKKPLPLIASDRSVVDSLVRDPGPIALGLMDRFWPGSLTILLNPAVHAPKWLQGPGGKIGVRVPPDCPARALAAVTGGWITATSANLSGDPEPREISDIAREALEAVDLVIDLGPTPGGKPSTVVEPLDSGIRVIRHGAVDESVLRDAIRNPRHKSS